MRYPKLAEVTINDSWAVSEGILDNKPIIVRIRQHLRPLAGHPELPNRLRVAWEYERDNDSGLPRSDELVSMQQCEDLLVSAFGLDNHAILTHVLTCDELRQWVFYSSDLQESANRINAVLPHDQPYPIELSSEPDAEWTEYLDTLHSSGL